MVSFPNAKINIGLHVIEKRPDGFHNIETIFFPIELKDALEIIISEDTDKNTFTHSGIHIPGDNSDNLCLKAYHLLKFDFPELPPVKIHLHKNIPIGAGLGGGSADGAFTLQMLNTKFNLGLSNSKLMDYALKLGSDCPFFIENKTSIATSRGEILEPIALELKDYKIVLINPGIHINTGWAFSNVVPQQKSNSILHIKNIPIEEWKSSIINDFEIPVFTSFPAIKSIKDELYQSGAVYASMSGTGSTVYGIFEKNCTPKLNFPSSYFLKWV